MNSKRYLVLWAAILLSATAGFCAAKPNVLLICVDDLKPALACYGDHMAITPSIDKLASRSTLFESAYCNQAVCAPSRNALMTGLRPDTIGIYDLATNFRRAVPNAVTLPQAFRKAGYETIALGKISHVGHGNKEDTASWSAPHWTPRTKKYALPQNEDILAKGGKDARGPATECADVPDETYGDGALATEAIKRMKEAKKDAKPFFLAVGFAKPHLPFVAPKKYWDLHQRQKIPLAEFRKVPAGAPPYAPQPGWELRQYHGIPKDGTLPDDLQRELIHGYYATTSYADAQIGMVIDALDELGLAKNTIVVLWGDHGWHLGDHDIWCKHTNYEQATRIPLLISAPGMKPGTRTRAFAENIDLYPTLCEIAGISVPDGLDGTSLVKAMRDPAAATKDHAFHVYPRNEKLGRAIRTERYRFVEWKIPGGKPESSDIELYDYRDDPLEKTNIARDNPEVVANLRKILARYPEAKTQVGTDGNPKKR